MRALAWLCGLCRASSPPDRSAASRAEPRRIRSTVRRLQGALCSSVLLLLTAIASGEALAAPYISIAASPASVEEGETITFTISRTGSTSSALEEIVIYLPQFGNPFVCDGSRCPVMYIRPLDVGYECAILPGVNNHRCFTIPAGKSSITVDVPTYPHTLHEEDGRVGFFIRGGYPEYTGMNHYWIKGPSRRYVTVRDGPDVTPDVKATLSIPDNRATEGDASDPATVVLTLTGADPTALVSPTVPSSRELIRGESLKVPLQFSGGTPGTDFTLSLSGNPAGVSLDASTSTVTFTGPASGSSAAAATLILTAADDPDADGATVTASIGHVTASGIPGSASGARRGDGRILLLDPDTPPPPQISISGGAGVTEGSAAIFTLNADPAPSDDISVEVEVSDSGDFATGGQDGSRTVTIGTGGSASLEVATANDGRDEPDGAITATIGSGDGYTVDSQRHTASVAVADDDVPVVAFASASSGAGEAAGTRNVTLDLDPAPGAGITLYYSVGGAATEGSGNDFTIESSGTVSVAAGAATATIPIAIVDDASDENAETVVLTLTDGTGYTLGSTKVHTLTITDDDAAVVPPGVTVSTDALGLAEGGAAGSYTVVLASKPTADVTVTATSGDAGKVKVHGPGGTAGASATLTFTPTTWNRAQTVTVTPQDDADADDESVAITHAVGNTGGYGGVTAGSVTVSVDDDETPTLSVAVAPATANEGAAGAKGYATVTFGLAPTRAQATSFKACLKSTGTATRGGSADYLFVGPSSDTPLSLSNDCHSYTLPANAASGQVRLLIRGDGEVEPDETVVVELRDPPQGVAVSGAAGLATYTIVNDDTAPNACDTASLKSDIAGYIGEQADGTPHVTRWKRVLATFGDDNGYAAMDVAEAQQNADDFWAVRWDPVVTALQCLENAGTNTDPEIMVEGGSAIAEGGDAVFTVKASPAPSSDLDVTLDVADNAAGDFLATSDEGSHTVTIPANQTSATLTLSTTADTTDEPNGSVSVTVDAGTGYTVAMAPGDAASVAVTDNDATAVVLTVPDTTAAEGDAADMAQITLTLGRGLADGETLVTPLQFAGGTAGTLFTLTCPSPLPAGVTCQTLDSAPRVTFAGPSSGVSATAVTLSLAAQEDAGAANETVTVSIPASSTGNAPILTATGLGGGATGARTGDGQIVITDNDAPASDACYAQVKPDVEGYAQETGNGPAHVTRWKRVLAAFGDQNGHTKMTVAEAQQNADDFWAVRWSPVVTALQCLKNAGTNTDPEITVEGGSAIAEGGNAVFTLKASPTPAANLAVTLTVDDDATSDFLAQGNEGTRTVAIQAGQSSATLTLATENDTTDEPNGNVSATVAGGTGYTVGSPNAATVAVSDDDDPPVATPVVRIAGGSGIAEGGTASFTLTATPAPAGAITVRVDVTDSGSFATGGQTGARTVTVGTSGTATLTVATADDGADEANGSIAATLQAGTGYTVAAPPGGTASVAVADNDEPVVSIAAGSGVTEGAPASFTLTARTAPHAALTVSLAVTQSGDYAASGQTGTRNITIPTGGSAAFEVATVNDGADEPDGSVTATLAAGSGYAVAASPDDAAKVAVADDDVAAAGVPTLSVNDVEVKEGPYRRVEFTVTLSKALEKGAWFYYRVRESSPVSAKRGVDFSASTGKKFASIRAGRTEHRIMAALVIDDSHDEDPETFEIVLSDAHGAAIADGVGVATIVNDDPMPAAWLARFGRTMAEQALDGIAGRIAAPRTAGAQGTIAGQALTPGTSPGAGPGTSPGADGAANDPGSGSGAGPGSLSMAANDDAGGVSRGVSLAQSDVARAFGASADRFGSHGLDSTHGLGESRTMTGLEALLGSSFTATGETDGSGGSLAFWGRAAQSSFDGREGTFSLDGETTTAMLGADYARGKWLVGLALMQSSGEGGYADAGTGSVRCPQDLDAETRAVLCAGAIREGDGDVEASLAAAVPYAAIQASERLRLWGAAGFGTGEVTLKPDVGGSLSSDISWTMAAAGARSELLPPPMEGSGPTLALTADALWAATSSEKTRELAESDSDATRFRVGLEGGYAIATEGGGSLVPRVEIGARHDGGDAETGFGVELGGGIAWTDPAIGLSLDLSGRTLIAHGNDDLEDRGFAASLAFDPDPATKRGPSFSLRQDWGGQASGGLDALFRTDPLADRAGGGEPESRWRAEAAWGFPAFSGRYVGSPHVGLGLATGARDYTLGWRLTPAANDNTPDLSLGVKGTRRESNIAEPVHDVRLEATMRW